MINIPPNPCTQCFADHSDTCHEQCNDIISYVEYRNKIQRLMHQGYSVVDAVGIVNEQYKINKGE